MFKTLLPVREAPKGNLGQALQKAGEIWSHMPASEGSRRAELCPGHVPLRRGEGAV